MDSILKLRDITKTYPGVVALDHVSLEVYPGEIHSIMGENGAGKSTLIKIVSGAIPADEGTVVMQGKSFDRLDPATAKEMGIGVVYQEFNLVPSMSVAENIYLGEKTSGKMLPDFRFMHEETARLMEELGVAIDPHWMVGELTTAKQQLVEIARAIRKNCKVLIMDEPTASISMAEARNMFRLLGQLREKGVAIIYISHRMDEVFELSDRVSVLRDGRYVATKKIGEVSRAEIIKMMVGRELTESFPARNVKTGETVLEAKDLCGNGLSHITFHLDRGEILGIGGLVGAGRTELAKMIFGDAKVSSGELIVKGKRRQFRNPAQAIGCGIGLVPEDRKREGAFLEYSIEWNIPCMCLKQISRWMVVDRREADRRVERYVKRLRIKTPTVKQQVRNLSGGNQQKVVMAKMLAAETDILIFDEPTRGIDVGAKQEIYRLMNELAKQGMSIIMISSELEELLGMSDRIIVLHEGRLSGELRREEFSQERVMRLASGMAAEL